MTGPGAPARGGELYRSGPFLIVYGSGPQAEDAALAVAKQCVARSVHAEVRPIDEIRQVVLVFYLALIVVLPSGPMTDLPVALRPFMSLIGDYRARRSDGLRSLHDGSCMWFAAGVVQVCGLRAIMHHPRASALLDSVGVCVRHDIDDFTPAADIFRPYSSEFTIPPGPGPGPADESIRKAWWAIQEWGVRDMQKVPTLRQCIDKCRHHFESDGFIALRRPNPRAPNSNMLDLVLDGPHDMVGDRKAWLENAARVCRHVRGQLAMEAPELRQPGTKNVQKQLRELYLVLRIVEQAMGDPGSGLPGRSFMIN